MLLLAMVMVAAPLEVAAGNMVRWSVPGTKRCAAGKRSWAALQETCYYPIDLEQAAGVLRVRRYGAGAPAAASVRVVTPAPREAGHRPGRHPAGSPIRRRSAPQCTRPGSRREAVGEARRPGALHAATGAAGESAARRQRLRLDVDVQHPAGFVRTAQRGRLRAARRHTVESCRRRHGGRSPRIFSSPASRSSSITATASSACTSTCRKFACRRTRT